MMSKSASFLQKYWFARGFNDRLMHSCKDVPSIEMVEYVEEVAGINILNEYELGYEQAEKDRVNNVI
jgi:hypothetical protein